MAAAEQQNLTTSKGHQATTLIGATFVFFGIVFIGFYSNNFWFSLNLGWYGIPVVVLCAFIALGYLLLLEGNFGCRLASPLLKGKPPVVFRQWVSVDGEGFQFGTRHVRFDAIDEVALTFFGNLEIRSRVICGEAQRKPDVIFKFPFAAAAQPEQQRFIQFVKDHRPSLLMNKRLEKTLTSPIVKGQNIISATGGAIMLLFLLDLGYSSSEFLEMLKHYYLADRAALSGQMQNAGQELRAGDNLRNHPLRFSWITNRILNIGHPAAGVSEARAEALWHMGRKDEAMAEVQKAIAFAPTAYRNYLHYARFLEESGRFPEAKEQMEKAGEQHKNHLLPKLYLIANAYEQKPELATTAYKQAMDDLNDKVFQEEPIWPPGGDTFLDEVFYRRDVYFIMDRLLKVKLQPDGKAK
ncbi:MAG TPA: bacterial transcriptional activator domain-containing protein [Candidatus Obscuribacterales bacterium]